MANKNKKKRKRFKLRHLIILFLVFMIGKTFISQGIMIKNLTDKKKKKRKKR